MKKISLKQMSTTLQFFITLLLAPALSAAPIKTLSLDFTRELTEKGTTETTSGTLHYDAKAKRVVVEVTEPLSQIMLVKGKVLEIYYPVEKQAFRFISEGRIPLPFVEAIIQSTQAEYGLTAMGYSLDRHDVKDAVLYTYWKPPEKAKDKLGEVLLGMREDRLISAEVKNPDGRLAATSHYQHHSKLGDTYIPMEVSATLYAGKSEPVQRERILYSHPQVNAAPPHPILTFTLPASVKVTEVKW